ncbi:SRPBCC domain-containing protein [Streptomyces polygonati]|uniref:SRPBCC domain-containing protein n=1 Tax=Streptomyces polygonati TaxID=1617087 RepID=A0ABV8HGG7_9ACTN
MSKPFEIVREFEVEASPEQVWEAVSSGTAGWLWPMEYEPREGGAAPFGGTVTAWDPPHRLTGRSEGPEEGPRQVFNQLDHLIEPREGGGSWVRYVHSGIFVDDWDNQYDGADKHTDFYLHTLREYLRHFTGRPAVFAGADGSGAAGDPDALVAAARALGLPDRAAAGHTVHVQLPGAAHATDVVLDYRDPYFIGLRTDHAMYRFFGRNRFGATVGVTVHDFDPAADPAGLEADIKHWLDGVYGVPAAPAAPASA